MKIFVLLLSLLFSSYCFADGQLIMTKVGKQMNECVSVDEHSFELDFKDIKEVNDNNIKSIVKNIAITSMKKCAKDIDLFFTLDYKKISGRKYLIISKIYECKKI